MSLTPTLALRGHLLNFTEDPERDPHGLHWHEDGLVLIAADRILAAGDYAALAPQLPAGLAVTHLPGKILAPGFVDLHVHYPQTDMIASPAAGLLPWLEHYTFPSEARFADPQYATEVAAFFCDELLRQGTTSALVFGTVHPGSVDALFAQAQRRGMRLACGKVMMDRHCPEFLRESAEDSARASEALIQRWHGKGRLAYALTPRFAPTSTPEQLHLAGALAARYPDVLIQSHVAENRDECAWVRNLYPEARSYLDVYARFGLLRTRAIYAHGIWLDEDDRAQLRETGAALAVCPTSNLFLGSGLFDFAAARAARCSFALATDVGAGTSFSMLHTMNEAYKVARLSGTHLSAASLFYHATLGAARCLGWGDQIGSLAPGKEADLIILDPNATPLLSRRSARCTQLEELLFALLMLGDDRAIHTRIVAGKVHHHAAP